MAKKRGKTPVYEYLERIERHLPFLVEIKQIREPTRQHFFTDFLSCGPTSYKNWFSWGIRKVYLCIALLLDELETHRKRIALLEKQLNEINKK